MRELLCALGGVRILQQLMHAMESTVPSGDKTEEEGVPTAPGATSEAEPSKFGVNFATSRTSGAPPETSGATASPVKPYTPVSAAQSSAIKMSSVNKIIYIQAIFQCTVFNLN